MKIKGIKYISPVFDSSGYGKASRGNILALHKLGVPITISPISFENIRPDFGAAGKILESLVKKDIEYDTVLVHSTPEFWAKFREPGKTFVGYTIWETTKLHPHWIGYINAVADKVLVGCEWNVKVFKESGVTVPMGVVPHGLDVEKYHNNKPYQIAGMREDAYVFYNVFQWTERKNPLALIKGYWYAFQNDENVALVLKTHRGNYEEAEKNAIRDTIKRLKNNSPLDKYPPVYYVSEMLSESELLGLHARGNCYVSLDRGEGFGIGPFEAGATGNPIIVTGFGGVTEYAKPDTAVLVNYSLTPVFGMPWSPWYRGDQLWAEPDVLHAVQRMQWAYEHQDQAKALGEYLRTFIANNFTWEHIGKRIIKELEVL
jgi:glycosyltransferase involved in cell wall biosynthesis